MRSSSYVLFDQDPEDAAIYRVVTRGANELVGFVCRWEGRQWRGHRSRLHLTVRNDCIERRTRQEVGEALYRQWLNGGEQS